MINENSTVVVGMSGGVDSSVSAFLLKKAGFRVIGMFMKNWEEDGVCPAAIDYEDVVNVCKKIDIPYYSVNFVKEYREQVFGHFIEECKSGNTPNPDILCNREIKFQVFLKKALELGADFLATGHYCQTDHRQLIKGSDANKDQSYFLHAIKQNVLEKVLFPIGHLEKKEVRRIAEEAGLVTAGKKDSTGICFIGKRNFKDFLKQYLQCEPGNFETLEGKIIGRHEGIAYYTVGQRKGLAIGGAGDAWFVVGKDFQRNTVLIEQGAMHPALFADELVAKDLTFIDEAPNEFPFACMTKIRYRQQDQPAIIESISNGKALVRFLVPQRAITQGQSVVFYKNDICLGGGVIETPGPSYYLMKKPVPRQDTFSYGELSD